MPRNNVYVLIDPEEAKKLMAKRSASAQAVEILRIIEAAGGIVSEAELKSLLEHSWKQGKLRTRQDPWQIYRSHKADLIRRRAIVTDPLLVMGKLIEKGLEL